MIRPATESDSEQIADIYNHYIKNTIVTFEEEKVDAADISDRIASTVADGLPWLVAEKEGQILGYAYASKWKGRCAYKSSVESTVYLDNALLSKGLGTVLYDALLKILREKQYHIVIGGIALPNDKSIALHEKFGFQKVGHFKEVGYKFDRWVDVGYWQVNLDE